MSFARCLLFLACLSAVQATVAPFDPLKYQKTTARCRATRRGDVDEVVDIQLKYVDVNPQAPSTILMVHGWPSLWSTWSYQIQEFEKDYHLVAPNLRGFGDSTHPGEPQTSGTMADLVGDLVCVLHDAKVASAICMGHDWGSSVCYEAARLRPDIFTGVVGLVVPYLPQGGPFVPIENLLPLFPTLTYQLFFDRKTDEAIAELDKDVRRSLRATLRTADSPPPESFLQSGDSFLAAWDSVKEIEPIPFFSPEEENYFVEQFSIQGFKDTLGFYSTKNRHQSWELAHSQGNFTLSQPVLAVYPMQDPVANWVLVSNILKSAQYIANFDVEAISGAHWVHLENPQETNRVIRNWLEKQISERQSQTDEHQTHLGDEL